MRNRIAYLTTIAAIAAFGFACSEPAHERESMAEGNGVRGQNQRVSLEGCVRPSGDGFALTNVVVPPPERQPVSQDTMEHPLIPGGSSVQLAGPDVQKYSGKQVSIIGDVVSPDRGVVGTTGQGSVGPVGGVGPKVAIEKIDARADSCAK
jgi:hypothetical protein